MFKIKNLKKFAVINELEDPLELKDLTIFMGDNSAGKSYLAMLVHSFVTMTKGYSEEDFLKAINNKFATKTFMGELKKAINTLVNDKTTNAQLTVLLDIGDLKSIIDFSINDYFFQKYLVSKIFDSVTIKNIEIELSGVEKSLPTSLIIQKTMKDNGIHIEVKWDSKFITNISFSGDFELEYIKEESVNVLISSLIRNVIKQSLPNTSVYLPASRTGYLQTYKILANKAVLANYSDEDNENKNTLNIMIRFFITQLNDNTNFQDNKFSKFIEDFIINGKVNIYKDNSDIDFELSDGKKIDLNYLSSTISELIPLVVFLKRGFIKADGLVVIEEPEAHLSFKNQKLIAKLIVFLTQNNIKVLITTHSDFLVYELNNLIMKQTLLKHDKEIKSGDIFDDAIALDCKKVALYNFILKDNYSVVKRIPIDKYGINNKYIFDSTYAMSKEKNILLDLMDSIDA